MASHGSAVAIAEATGQGRARGLQLADLDNGVLLRIFQLLSPFDRFSVAGTARHYRDLVKSGRLYLLVASDARSRSWRQHRHVYATLQAAVEDSRPGETIVLEDGAPHAAGDVAIRHPLHIVGSGRTPADTVLQCAAGATAALDFRSSGKLANLAIKAVRAACVRHHQGSLWVEQCDLQCEAPRGLEHLFSPMITSASSPSPQQLPDPVAERPGAISVIETTIQGGMTVIQTLGTGSLRNVRCSYQQRVYYYFDVDSKHVDISNCRSRLVAAAGPQQPRKTVKRKWQHVADDSEAEAAAEVILDERALLWSAGLKMAC